MLKSHLVLDQVFEKSHKISIVFRKTISENSLSFLQYVFYLNMFLKRMLLTCQQEFYSTIKLCIRHYSYQEIQAVFLQSRSRPKYLRRFIPLCLLLNQFTFWVDCEYSTHGNSNFHVGIHILWATKTQHHFILFSLWCQFRIDKCCITCANSYRHH